MAHTDPAASSPTEDAMNALDTRDITLPQRLWSWLTKQARDRECSVDEVVAALIDAHRHPEQATTHPEASDGSELSSSESSLHETASPAKGKSPQGEDPDQEQRITAADRLREMSERLDDLRDEDAADGAQDAEAEQLQAARGDGASRHTLPSENSLPEQQQSNADALINQAMSALHEPSSRSVESDDASENNSDDQSMFDVVREEE